MNEAIKLAIEGYNQEKIKIQEHLRVMPESSYGSIQLNGRLREIDNIIKQLCFEFENSELRNKSMKVSDYLGRYFYLVLGFYIALAIFSLALLIIMTP